MDPSILYPNTNNTKQPTNHQLSAVLNGLHPNDTEEDEVVETDPSGRFERYKKNLGKGAYKEVFKAFDQEEGVEVAWNQIRSNSLAAPDINRIHTEILILESLRNENIINLLYSWRAPSSTPDKDDIFFITEFMSSGSLKGYIKRTKGKIKSKIIRNWCLQILKGLNYLHNRNPPIIHRDLKCENIFINGNNGTAKIGDLGLAVVKATQHLSSVLGTPEFMAPELYDEQYDEKIDIYAFGLVVLEIATKEYPYSECTNQAQIYRKVSTGVKPAALAQVEDPEIRSFIELCIEHNPTKRPSATALLGHPFFDTANIPTASGSAADLNMDLASASSSDPSLYLDSSPKNIPYIESSLSQSYVSPPREAPSVHHIDSDQHQFYISRLSSILRPKATCEVEVLGPVNLNEVTLKMIYHTGTSALEIKFPFNLGVDTATDVVEELVKENLTSEVDKKLTRRRIEEAIRGILIQQLQNGESFHGNSGAAAFSDDLAPPACLNPGDLTIVDASGVESGFVVESNAPKQAQISPTLSYEEDFADFDPFRKCHSISLPVEIANASSHSNDAPVINRELKKSYSLDSGDLGNPSCINMVASSDVTATESPINPAPLIELEHNLLEKLEAEETKKRVISQKLTELAEQQLRVFGDSKKALFLDLKKK